MHDLFTVHVWLSIAGGSMGGLKAFYRANDARMMLGECLINFCISVATSVSITTYIFNPQTIHPFIYLGVAIPAGYLSIFSLEIARTMLPGIMQTTFHLQQGAEQSVNEK